MNARILVVEDEEALTTLLRYNLDAEGYEVETVGRGDDADTRLKERVPDLIVLDWMLPGLSGIELCRRLRARPETKALPIIMLTARGEESERVRGLATGADDYIVKPFSVPELLARVKGLLRRASPERLATILTYGDIELDREKRRVARSGRPIDLGPTEYRLLEFFLEHPGRVFSPPRVIRAIGQAGQRLAATEEEFRTGGIADRPMAGRLIQLEQRQPLAHRHHIVVGDRIRLHLDFESVGQRRVATRDRARNPHHVLGRAGLALTRRRRGVALVTAGQP